VPELFEKSSINTLELHNRADRSATWSGVCDPKGYITEKALEFYGNLAQGGVGLIVTGFQFVMPNAIAMPFQMGNYNDDQLEGLSRLVERIHSSGGKVAAQLVHTGSKANPELFFEEGEVWGASAVLDPFSNQIPKEMTLQDINACIEAFASAAARSQKAGFDAIQLHGAHAYGINQFLSGASNRRSDKYGGTIAKRYLFLAEVMEAVRGAVGKDYPVFINLSGKDYLESGLTTEESLYVARRLVEDGIDCIEVSAGSRASSDGMVPSRPEIRTEKDEAYLGHLAAQFKEAVPVPIVTVGGIRSPNVISKILSARIADYVAMSRPFIREPHLINRWKDGDLKKSKCISCNGCFETGRAGLTTICKVELDRKTKQKS